MRIVSFVVLLNLCFALTANDEDKKLPKVIEADIEWPVVDSERPPVVQATNKLAGDTILDVRCRTDCMVIVSPSSAVKVTKEVVPAGETLRQKGNFISGVKSRSWKGPCVVYLFEATEKKDGVEIYFIPFGYKSEDQVTKKVIDVDVQGARPPPLDPVTPVDPPVDPAVKKASKVTVVICESLVQRSVAQAATINDPGFRSFVTATGGTVELVSVKDKVYADNNLKSYAEKVGLPAVIVFDAEATGPTPPLSYFKLPATPADLTAQIGKVVKK